MACRAAIAAVRAALPPAPSGYRHKRLPAVTPQQIFERINWWTLPTICEALDELVKVDEATGEKMEHGELGFRLTVRPKMRTGL